MRNKVLVVDDEPFSVTVMADELTEAGYDVLVAYSGEEAIHSALYSAPHIILLDVVMPDMDGYEVCKMLKNSNATKDIPVVILTALDDNASRNKATQAGADGFMCKPLNMAELLTRFNDLLHLNGGGSLPFKSSHSQFVR